MIFPHIKSKMRRHIAAARFSVLIPAILLLAAFHPSGVEARLLGDDPGIPDSVIVSSADVNAGDHFKIDITLVNDEELVGGTIGIGWGTPDLFLDSISFVGSVLSFLPDGQRPTTIDNINFNSLTGFFIFGDPPLLPGKGLYASLWFTVDPLAPDQFVNIDSVFVPPSGDFLLVAKEGNVDFIPQFVGATVKIGNPVEASTIATVPGSFSFSAIQGSVNPPAQTLNITNIGLGSLNWSASVSSSWLTVAPAAGIAPSVTQVRANHSGLAVGTYTDEIVLTDPNATNSPFFIPVTLVVSDPPPIISVSQSSFFFNAIADSTNPPPQTLTIVNTGVVALNWQAANNESWLSLSPNSGGNFTNATLLVDITGLAFGDYFDTLTITDPAATNSPVRVAVNLSVASDLPIIKIEPDTLVIVVDRSAIAITNPVLLLDSGFFQVLNDGAGNLNFTLTRNVSRILILTPDSGLAPDSVLVTMRYTGSEPDHIFDTIWVSSPQAINSPQPLIVHSYLSSDVATLGVPSDTVDFSLFECEQQFGFTPQFKFAGLSTFGESVPYTLSFNADWLATQSDAGFAPGTIAITVIETGLPLGVYLDSIKVDAPLAEENPKFIFVRLTIKPADQPAQIIPAVQFVNLTARAGTDFQYCPTFVMEIHNLRGGCFNWTIDNQIPWLTITPSSGENPGQIGLIPDATTLGFGFINDQFSIISPEAEDSPEVINVRLSVWTLFGDADYSGRIDIRDITYLIRYIFANGPAPEPAIKTGDSNCDGFVNVTDITFLIKRIFAQADSPCGNPLP